MAEVPEIRGNAMGTLEEKITAVDNALKNAKRLVGILGVIVVPLLVVVITVVGTRCTAIKQTELNNKLQSEINGEQAKQNAELQKMLSGYQATLTAYIESQKHVQEQKATFYRDVKSTLSLVDTEFTGLTHFAYKKKNDSLTKGLVRLFNLIQNPPFNTDVSLIAALTAYDDFVAMKWREFDTNPADDLRLQSFKDSQVLLSAARDALEKYLPLAPDSK